MTQGNAWRVIRPFLYRDSWNSKKINPWFVNFSLRVMRDLSAYFEDHNLWKFVLIHPKFFYQGYSLKYFVIYEFLGKNVRDSWSITYPCVTLAKVDTGTRATGLSADSYWTRAHYPRSKNKEDLLFESNFKFQPTNNI